MVAEILLAILASLSLLGGLLGLPMVLAMPERTVVHEALVVLLWVLFAVSLAGGMALHHLRQTRALLQRIEALLERR